MADKFIDDCKGDWNAIVCPGGMPGATNLADSQTLSDLLRSQQKSGRIIAAICASPAVILAPIGLLNGKQSG